MSRRAKAAPPAASSNPVFELTDMSIDYVSLVPAGANRQRKWLVRKADGSPAGVAPGDPGAPSEQSTEEQAPSPTDRPAFCPYCGAALPVGCLNCPGCDRPVPGLVDPVLPVPAPAPEPAAPPAEPEETNTEPPEAPTEPTPDSSAPPAKPVDEEPKPGEPKPEPPKPDGEDEEERPEVPGAEATDEDKQAAQQARAKEYEIEALAGTDASLTWPADAPTKLDLYGDPVNLKYPLGGTENKADPEKIGAALSGFKQAADKYTQAGSRGKVYARIVAAALAAGIAVTYDPQDPIDQLLPGDLKGKLEELNKAGEGAQAPAPSQGGTPPSTGSDLSGWLADMGAKAEAMLVDAKLSAALATPQPMAAAAPAPAPAVTKAPAIEATGQQVVAKAAAELASATAQAEGLRLQLDAQRAEVARLAKGVGLSSSLPTGERPNVNKEQAGPTEAASRAWRGGGDLAAAVAKQ
jgi:hypothetical protein